eukprot:jgi/Hompol1/1471/HPOL_000347-RA
MTYPKLKLTYFKSRGRGEACRLALYIAEIPFEDERIDGAAWPKLKPFTPLGQLPVLTINDTDKIAQSGAILRYAGALGGLYPKDDALRCARIDQIVFHVEDIMNAMIPLMSPSEDLAAHIKLLKQISEIQLPPLFASLNRLITKHGNGTWSVGNSITIADVVVYLMIAAIKTSLFEGLSSEVADKHTAILGVFFSACNHPRIAEWEVQQIKK